MPQKLNPYLVVEFTQRPAEGVNTSVKGWMDDPNNLKTFEKVYIVDRLDNIDHSAGIVINLSSGEIVRKNINKPDDEIVAHYISKYERMIHEALVVWTRREIAAAMKEDIAKQKEQ